MFQLLKLIVQFLAVIVLSRLLEPADFGIVAMVAVVIALADQLRDMGLSVTALQTVKLSTQQASNLFWANVALSILAASLVTLSTPILIIIYDEPRLQNLVPVLGFGIIFNGLQAQYRVRLAREFRFVSLNLSELVAHLIAFLAAVVGALLGLGFWALAIQAVTMPAMLLLMNVTSTRWIPNKPARDGVTLPLLKSGLHHSGTAALSYASSNIDTFLIGARFGANDLGLYNRAFQLLVVPVQRLIGSLTPVAVTTVNSAKSENQNVYAAILRLQSLLATATTLLFSVGAVVADPLIPLLLGEQWKATAILFQLLAAGGAALSLSQVSYWIFLTETTSKDLLKYTLVTKPMVIVIVIGASFISVEAVAIAYSASLILSWFINVIWVGRTANAPAKKLLLNGIRVLISGALTVILVISLPIDKIATDPFVLMTIKFVLTVVVFSFFIATTKAGRNDLQWAVMKISKKN